jgi:hypothetical protein
MTTQPQQEHCDHECVCGSYEIGMDDLEIQCQEPCRISRCEHDTRTHTPAAPVTEPKFNSTDLLLLANDEWKRREERKHNHENIPWCAGFINGFLTDKKWARGWVDKIQKDAESLRGGA